MPLSEKDVEAELSYAYLHAIASRAGFSCQQLCRTADGFGIDAQVRAQERFEAASVLTDIGLDIQLKATYQDLPLVDGRYSYALPVGNYNVLRQVRSLPAIVVLLVLPREKAAWLAHSEESLVAKRCAYWVGLLGAPATANEENITVYIPKVNVFSVEALRALCARVSRLEDITYAG
jgi:hypothetical protein